MKRILLLLVGFMFVGCASVDSGLDNLQNNVNKGYEELQQNVQKYENYKQKYKEKRVKVRQMIDLYKGETWNASEQEDGIQDVIFRQWDEFTEDEKELLREADAKVRKFVSTLKELDQKFKELDQKVQEGRIEAREFVEKFNRIIEKSRDYNKKLEVVGNVIGTSLKLGMSYINK